MYSLPTLMSAAENSGNRLASRSWILNQSSQCAFIKSFPLARPVSRHKSVSPMPKACGTHQTGPKVVGLGSLGTDYLAQVSKFPQPDEKLRTEDLKVQGGGNCANALTGAARLGLQPVIVTRIGDDSLGDNMLQELEDDGVGTAAVLRSERQPSPFTYIIVDRSGGTRTCIHTASAPLVPEDLTPSLIRTILKDAAVVFFDGRLTEAALVLAAEAKTQGIPILVEAERQRDRLPELLQLATFITSSAHYPQEVTGEGNIGAALVAMMTKLPNARWICSTQGSQGSVLLQRGAAGGDNCSAEGEGNSVDGAGSSVEDDIEVMWQEVSVQRDSPSLPGCMTPNGAAIGAGSVAVRRGKFSAAPDSRSSVTGRLWVASAAHLSAASPVVDTTGAGDAYNAALLYSIAQGLPPGQMMTLAAVVAGCNCTSLGARSGMPHASNVDGSLLA